MFRLIGTRRYTSKSIPEFLRRNYSKKLKQLLSYKRNKVVSIDTKAEEIFIEMHNGNEKSLVGVNSSIRAWANRKPGFILRIAGIGQAFLFLH